MGDQIAAKLVNNVVVETVFLSKTVIFETTSSKQ